MAKFIGWAVIIVLVLVGISTLLNDDEETSSDETTSSIDDTKPAETAQTPKIDSEIARTEIQHVSSSKNGIVACPTSTGIERFIDVAVDDNKDDDDRTRTVDNNNCRIVGERDVITLLTEKQADGSTPLAGQYTYEIGTSAFAIILVDIERGENRVPSARDIEDGRYWVITSIVFDNSWKMGEEPSVEVEPEPEPEPDESKEEQDYIFTVDSLNPVVACYNTGVFQVMADQYDFLGEAERNKRTNDFVNGGACKKVRAGESMLLLETEGATISGPNGEIILAYVRLLSPEPGYPIDAYVIGVQLIMNTKVSAQ